MKAWPSAVPGGRAWCPRRQSRVPRLPESSCLCPSSRPEPQLLHLPVVGKRFPPGRAFAGVGQDDAGRAGGPGRGRHVTAGSWPRLTRRPRLAFQAEGRGARDQQPHAGPALPAPPRPAPPRPRHVRLFPPVGDLGDRPRCPGGSAAAPHQVRSRGPCGVRGAGLPVPPSQVQLRGMEATGLGQHRPEGLLPGGFGPH